MHLVLRDQARGELLRQRRVALVIGEDQLELGAAEVRQADPLGERQVAQFGMIAVDDLGDQLGGGLRGLAGRAGIAGERPHDADLDVIGGDGGIGGEQRGDGCRGGRQNERAFQGSLPGS